MTDFNYLICLVMRGKEINTKLNIERRFRMMKLNGNLRKVVVPVFHGEEVLYPGYVIVQMVVNNDTMSALKKSPGVMTVFSRESIRMEEIEIMKKSMMMNHGEAIKNRFSVGDSVVIKDGSFNNMKGKVSTVLSNGKRVVVDVKIFGRTISMNVDSSVISIDDSNNE